MSFSLIGGGYGDVLLVPFSDLQKRGGGGGKVREGESAGR